MTAAEQVEQWTTAGCGMPDADPTSWTAEQQATFLQQSQRFLNSLMAKQLEVIAAFDAAGGAQQLGARTTASWLRSTTRLTEEQSGSMVHTARALRDDLPRTREALAAGDVTIEHVQAIRQGHRRLGAAFCRLERGVADYAREHDVKQTRRLIARVIDQYDPAASDEDAEQQRESRYVHLNTTLGGWWRLDGLLDPATGEKLRAAMDAFAQRCGEDDPRIPKQRRCDALSELADRALALVDRVSGAASVTITVTPEQLSSGDGIDWPHSLLMSRTDLAVHSCASEVCYVAGIPTDRPPRWEPLAVGMSQRYATRAQRRALAARDGGCVYPGCTVRPERCIAHHIVHWRDGGPTDLPNLVLLCDFHHRQVHLGRIQVIEGTGQFSTSVLQRAPP